MALRSSPRTDPAAVWAKPMTPASGVATARATATDSATARGEVAGPDPQGGEAGELQRHPGVRAAPPTTST